jgi:hypothetical protein
MSIIACFAIDCIYRNIRKASFDSQQYIRVRPINRIISQDSIIEFTIERCINQTRDGLITIHGDITQSSLVLMRIAQYKENAYCQHKQSKNTVAIPSTNP